MQVGKKPPSLRALKMMLKDTQSCFNDILQFADGFKEGVSITEVEVRLQKLDELWERFSEILIGIRSHEDFPEDSDAYEKERKQFSDSYYRVKSFLVDKIKVKSGPSVHDQSIHSSESTGQGASGHVRLPQIRLQMFNGDIDEWLSFRDLFTSLIHWKTELPEVEKFHYLKGCLQGEPRSIIDSLQMTKANYQIAWDTLLKRYNDSKLLKKRQVQSLFKLPSISKESATDLHILLESFERIVQTLDKLVQPEEYKDLLLMNLLTTRLDPATCRGWEEFSSTQEKDTLKGLSDFLHRRVQVLDSLPSKAVDNKGVGPPQGSAKPKPMVKTSYGTIQSSGGRCVACSANHLLYQCGTFQRLSVSERDAFLRTHSLCRNCLRSGHLAKDCQSKFSCRNCKGRHHSMVCFKRERDGNSKASDTAKDRNSSASNDAQTSSSSSQVAAQISVSNTAHDIGSQILLATVVLIVEDDDGNLIPARALLDSGSESNFITERLSQRLKVDRKRVDVSVTGIGQTTTRVKQRIQVTIRSRVSEFSRELGFLVLPKVTVNLPTTSIRAQGWTVPQNVQLADPSFFVSKGVDMVLGIEAFFDFFVTGRRMTLGDQLPALNESVFGWVVSGGLSTSCQPLHVNCNISTSEELEALVARFWTCEEIEAAHNYSREEARCEEIYVQTVKRATDGRYTVSLPKREGSVTQLGESRDIAFRRLLGTERRLARDADLKEKYISFMDKYLQTGHMTRVEGTSHDSVKRCYLPHHPVVKEASTTTKVRVVFDASCKTSSGVSLNDVLLTGPVIQDDIRAIILRCRTKQIMLVADVERMFEQVNITPEDAPLQSILFRSSPAEEVATFELNTVTYGTKSAPFLATRTLKQLAMDEEGRFPLAAKATTEDTYMDDVITGSNNVKEAVELRKQLDEMMSSGGFRLRKWASNRPAVLEGVAEENLAIPDTNGINLDPNPSVKTLGLTWMLQADAFRFQFNIPVLDSTLRLSKRRVLSIIATLFDPLGLVGAVITTAKLFMQLLWTLQNKDGSKLDWDDPLPTTVGFCKRFGDLSHGGDGAPTYIPTMAPILSELAISSKRFFGY
ncbi:uncharacterized protein LOC135704593 [Ochlerotatus camptorhynchus]|uniref:uncharacterized protein LOC135704593 n=1 Tax=Ochlerotatus camptorhynchus TaxID=644619 RepID=UPI0031DCC493